MNKIHSLVLPSLGCGEDRSVGYLQRCYDVLHHHEVDKEDDKNDEERHVEESVLDQSSQDLLPNTEVTCQYVRLGQREYNPTQRMC